MKGSRFLFIHHSLKDRRAEMRNTLVLLLTVIVITIPACSKESLKRIGYNTLQNIQKQKCRRNPETECPEQASYENYQRKRQELETSGY